MKNVIFLIQILTLDCGLPTFQFSVFGKCDDRSRHLRRGLGNLPDQQREQETSLISQETLFKGKQAPPPTSHLHSARQWLLIGRQLGQASAPGLRGTHQIWSEGGKERIWGKERKDEKEACSLCTSHIYFVYILEMGPPGLYAMGCSAL